MGPSIDPVMNRAMRGTRAFREPTKGGKEAFRQLLTLPFKSKHGNADCGIFAF